MPFVDISSTAGAAHMYYSIATPTNPSAQHIDRDLPTVIFLHPVYIASQIFHPQFLDPSLRRFNLIACDSRCHGESIGHVPKNFTRLEASEDIFQLMKSLDLPPCHIVGLSMGACIGLSLAINHPDRVLSVTMLSPLPLEEPQDVAEGRQEIYDCWAEGFHDPDSVDEYAITDSVYGSLQLGFNNATSGVIHALIKSAVPQAKKNWDNHNLDAYYEVSVGFFIHRKPHPRDTLAKVRCPVLLVHCGGDIAYPFHYATELADALKGAGVDVTVRAIPDACHFGSVTHPKQINRILHDWLVAKSTGEHKPGPVPATAVVSPFTGVLGSCSSDSSDSDDTDYYGS